MQSIPILVILSIIWERLLRFGQSDYSWHWFSNQPQNRESFKEEIACFWYRSWSNWYSNEISLVMALNEEASINRYRKIV